MRILLELFLTFAKIGCFTFGGGLAMIPVIENTCVDKKKWISHEEMMTLTVIAESTPGPIAINCATFVGYKKAKLKGSVIATIGMVLPSFLIIYLISLFLDDFLAIAWVARAFTGIKAAVGILIIDAGLRMLKKMKKTPFAVTVLITAALAMTAANLFALNISSVVLILAAGLIGVIASAAGRKAGEPA